MLPFDNVIVTVPNITPQKLKDLMEWGVAARTPDESNGNGKFPQISGFKIVVSGSPPPPRRRRRPARRSPSRAPRIQSITLDNGTKIVENGAVVAGAPNVNLATTNFTANNGDTYPFSGPFQLLDRRRTRTSSRCSTTSRPDLGGVVTAAQVPGRRLRPHHDQPRDALGMGTAR